MGRRALAGAATALIAVLAGGCFASGAPAPQTSTPSVPMTSFTTRQGNGFRIKLRYPAAWRRYTWQVVSSFTDSMLYLGTDREHHPCTTAHPGGATEIEIQCGAPIHQLARGGVLVTWTAVGFPEPSGTPPLAGDHGKRVPAPAGWIEKVSMSPAGVCDGLDASAGVTAYLAPKTGHGTSLEMNACLRGPHLALHTAEVLQVLRSVRLVRAA